MGSFQIANVRIAQNSCISDSQIERLRLPGAAISVAGHSWLAQFGEDESAIEFVRGPDGLDLTCVKAHHDEFVADLSDVAHCLRLVEALSALARVQLVWTASNVTIDGSAVGALVQRWSEINEPPVLWIVALDLENSVCDGMVHRTHGLIPFVGHELRVHFSDRRDSRKAARTLARVARHALMNGPIRSDARFVGLDGQPLRLASPAPDQIQDNMVTIIL